MWIDRRFQRVDTTFSYRRRDFSLGVPGKPMVWNWIQVKDRGVRGIVKGGLGHIVKLVFPGRIVTLFAGGNVSDVVGSASVQSGGGSTGTARVVFRRSKLDWTQMRDKDRMMPLPAKVTSLATLSKAV